MTKKIAFINDTNSYVTFIAEFTFYKKNPTIEDCLIDILYVWEGDAENWLEWMLPNDLKIIYLEWIDNIKTDKKKIIKYLFRNKEDI